MPFNNYDVIVFDISLADLKGHFKSIIDLKSCKYDVPIVALINEYDNEFCNELISNGADTCLQKNELSPRWLSDALLHAIYRKGKSSTSDRLDRMQEILTEMNGLDKLVSQEDC